MADQPAGVLNVVQHGPVRHVTLARPERRNALSRALIAALAAEFSGIELGNETRVVVLGGEGTVFCAGADLTEFAEAADLAAVQAEAANLADMLQAVAACPAPVIARVHGAAFGGGVGLTAAGDIAVAAQGTRFSLSEARLGLAPAVISPYVVAALGPREAAARMLLAEPFDAAEALRIGLVHQVCDATALDATVERLVAQLLLSPPGALAAIKRLVTDIGGRSADSVRQLTTALIAERRASDEGQEGMAAFLEKRSPTWAVAAGAST